MGDDQRLVATLVPDVVGVIRRMLEDKSLGTRESGIKAYHKLATEVFKREEALERMASDRVARFLEHVDQGRGGGLAGTTPFRAALRSG